MFYMSKAYKVNNLVLINSPFYINYEKLVTDDSKHKIIMRLGYYCWHKTAIGSLLYFQYLFVILYAFQHQDIKNI